MPEPIQSGATSDQLTIDGASHSLRASIYSSAGYSEAYNLTYSAAKTDVLVAPASTLAFFRLRTVTNDVRVVSLRITGNTLQAATAVAVNGIVVKKWGLGGGPSGGTVSNLSGAFVPLDSNDAAATAIAEVWTVAPTGESGSFLGTLACRRFMLKNGTITDGAESSIAAFVFGDGLGTKPVVLRNASGESLTAAFTATPASTVNLGIEVQWIEVT